MAGANLIVTGLPRAGSALVGALIDSLPSAVCLNTPPWQVAFARNPVDILPFCKWLVGDFFWARQQLLLGEPITDIRAADGQPLLDGLRDARITRDDAGEPKAVAFARPNLPEDFTLAMRQTTLFTAVLPVLKNFAPLSIVAVVRHPVDVCLSWYGLPQPVLAQGAPPGIARFWPEALETLQGGGLAEQFMRLYELYVQRYHELGIRVLRYEDVVADPMGISQQWGYDKIPAAAAGISVVSTRPENEKTEALRQVFHKHAVYAKHYYPDL